MPTACTYHLRRQTYSCDPKFSTAVFKGAVEHILESAMANTNEYLNRRVMPIYETYPSLTVILAMVVGYLVTRRYRWFLVRMWLVLLGLVILHAWTRERA